MEWGAIGPRAQPSGHLTGRVPLSLAFPDGPQPRPRPPAVPRGRATPAASRSPRTFVPPIPPADTIAWGVGGAGWAVGGAPRGAEGAEVENRPPAAPFKMGGLGGQVSVPAA